MKKDHHLPLNLREKATIVPFSMDYLSRDVSLADFMASDRPIRGYEDVRPPQGGGRFLPLRTITRALESGVFSAGGALVTDNVSDQVVAPLRPFSVCLKLGAQLKTNLTPPYNVPVLGTDLNPSWLAEGQSDNESDLSVSWASVEPHRLTISAEYGQLLTTQSKADVSAMLAAQALAKIMCAIDAVALAGTGGAQPIGILNQKGTQAMSFGGPISWAAALSFEQQLANANASPAEAKLGFAVSPDVRAKWKATQRATGTSTFIMDDYDRVSGEQAYATTELNAANANNRVIFGDWTKLYIFLFFGGMFVLRNPYTKATQGIESATFTMFTDVGLVQPQAMIVSADSGAQ